MNKSIVFRICLFLIVLACALSTVYGYNVSDEANIETEGLAKGCITFIRSSIASEDTREKYLKVAGEYGKWIESVDFILPTTSTYQIAYYMFSPLYFKKDNVVYSGKPIDTINGTRECGYCNYTSGQYSKENFVDNINLTKEQYVSSGVTKVLNKYVKSSSGDYVAQETTDKLFGYDVIEVCIFKRKNPDGVVFYELREKIALKYDATEKLQTDEGAEYYVTPVFYTFGTPTDTPTSTNPSIYATTDFYAYTLEDFSNMKPWDSSVYGLDGLGLYSVINQMGNKISVPAKQRTEKIILKYVRLTAREQLVVKNKNYELTKSALNISPVEIDIYKYEDLDNYEDEAILYIHEKMHEKYDADNDEIVAYSVRSVNSESDLVVGRPTTLRTYKNEITISKDNLVTEIIVYSVPKQFEYTIKLSHTAEIEKENKVTNLLPNETIKLYLNGSSNEITLENENTNDKEIYGMYKYMVDPNSKIKITVGLYTTSGLVDLKSINYSVNGSYKGQISTTATTLNIDLGTITSNNTSSIISINYKARRGASAEVDYKGLGSLEAKTFLGEKMCDETILSIPNNDEGNEKVKVYLGTYDALQHYVKGITSESYICYSEAKNIDNYKEDNDPEAFNTEIKIEVDGPVKGDVDKKITYIRDQFYIRLHNITQLAVYSISKIDFFNSGSTADTFGAELFDEKQYTQKFSYTDNDIKIKVTPANPTFSPYYTYNRSKTINDVASWGYPLKYALETTIQDFKNNVMDLISPYAFTNTNPYARTFYKRNGIGTISPTYEFTTYDANYFTDSIKRMINQKLGLKDDKDNNITTTSNKTSISLDFANIYTDKKGDDGNWITKPLHKLVETDKYFDINNDNVVNHEDLNTVYEATDAAYIDYLLTGDISTFKDAYEIECKFVDLYDEILVMQALAQMFSNLNEIGWKGIIDPVGYISYKDAGVDVTVGTKNTTVVARQTRNTSQHDWIYWLNGYEFSIQNLYSSGKNYSIYYLDYEGANIGNGMASFYNLSEDMKMRRFFMRKFAYWGIQRHEIQVLDVIAFKKTIETVTIKVDELDENGKVIGTKEVVENKPKIQEFKKRKDNLFWVLARRWKI